MEKCKNSRYRKNLTRLALWAGLLLALFAADLTADGGADRRLQMRHRLDSLEVETQLRKRQGKPIDDLESAAAALRDSLMDMREPVPEDAKARAAALLEPEKPGSGRSPLDALSAFLEGTLRFKPQGTFDWVIVGTGFVALLSLFMLVMGIVFGRKKRPAALDGKSVRKMNLSPTGPQAAVPPGRGPAGSDSAAPPLGVGSTYNAKGRMDAAANDPAQGPMANLQSLMEQLRRVAPPPAPMPVSAPPASSPAPAPIPAPAPPPPPPPSLVVDAADDLPPARMPPPSRAQGDINDRVAAAARSGMSEQEISRHCQISVDQVRLILKMMNR